MIRTAAMLALVGASWASFSAEPLGRLFHSPAQRSTLDSQRKAMQQPQKPVAPRPQQSQPTHLDGYVVRSDGRSTLWVNGSAVAEKR